MTQVTITAATATIVPTFQSAIGGIPALCCDARTLHAYLGSGDRFADWIKARVEKYGFEAGRDFESFSGKAEKPQGGRPATDYHLSLNMAKELSMVENNEQGRAARRYFLECERRALEAVGQVVPASHTDTLIPSEQQTLSELVHRRVAGAESALQGKALAEIWSRLHHKFRVAKYNQLARTQLADAIAYVMGMQIKALPNTTPVAPQAASEPITANDWRNIKRTVWAAVNGFRYEGVWTQAVWFYLRHALGVPSHKTYGVEHLPRIAIEMQTILSAAQQVHALMDEIEQEAARRIFRKGEAADLVIPDLRGKATARLAALKLHTACLPIYLQHDITAIAQRAPGHFDHGGDEQPNYFNQGVTA